MDGSLLDAVVKEEGLPCLRGETKSLDSREIRHSHWRFRICREWFSPEMTEAKDRPFSLEPVICSILAQNVIFHFDELGLVISTRSSRCVYVHNLSDAFLDTIWKTNRLTFGELTFGEFWNRLFQNRWFVIQVTNLQTIRWLMMITNHNNQIIDQTHWKDHQIIPVDNGT